jgi:chaperonin cofactor prefoldin
MLRPTPLSAVSEVGAGEEDDDIFRDMANLYAQAQAVPAEVHAEMEQLRERVAESEERQRKSDAELDLLRNALQRRDELLVSQRTAYYKELLKHKGYAQIASIEQPSATLAEVLKTERLATAGRRAAEKPAFFDACIFEAAHVEVDEPLVKRMSAALQATAAREHELQVQLDAAQRRADGLQTDVDEMTAQLAQLRASGAGQPSPAPAPAVASAPTDYAKIAMEEHAQALETRNEALESELAAAPRVERFACPV